MEQSIPVSFAFFDSVSSIANASFADHDLDIDEIGGFLSWSVPSDTSQVMDYVVYLAEDAKGMNRTYFGNTSFGTNDMVVAADTVLLANSRFLIYTRSVGSPLMESSCISWFLRSLLRVTL